jgi:hypothetical protein
MMQVKIKNCLENSTREREAKISKQNYEHLAKLKFAVALN